MWPFTKKPTPAPEPKGDGVLFGLNPPEGCHFKVFLHDGDAWFVEIWEGEDKRLASDLEFIRRYDRSNLTDEEAITKAAKGALEKLARKRAVKELEGSYPPKRTGA